MNVLGLRTELGAVHQFSTPAYMPHSASVSASVDLTQVCASLISRSLPSIVYWTVVGAERTGVDDCESPSPA